MLSAVKNYVHIAFFSFSTVCLFITLLLGLPFKYLSTSTWRAWTDYCKGLFGKLLVNIAYCTSPAKVKVYSPERFFSQEVGSGATQLLNLALSPRAVVTMNHQLYSDWVYMWWLTYTSNLQTAPVIALKRSLKNIPLFGWGMQFFRFLFLSRKWASDEQVIKKNTAFFAEDKSVPLWMMLFPEGTVFNRSTKEAADQFVMETTHQPLALHDLLYPRSKGLQAILKGLKGSVPLLYDITVVYGPVPPKGHEDVEFHYSLKNSFIKGKGPSNIKIHIRQFPITSIPYMESHDVFMQWLYERWIEKDMIYHDLVADNLQDQYKGEGAVKLHSCFELIECFIPLLLVGLLIRIFFLLRK